MKLTAGAALLSLSLSFSLPASLEASLTTVAILPPLRRMEDAEGESSTGQIEACERALPARMGSSTRILNAVAKKVPFGFLE